jgi:uncharacterized membrane protein YcaP (DUF421 family)
MFFDNFFALLRVVVAAVLAYTALVAAVRIAGKRSLAKLNAFDLIVTVAFGSTLATVLLSRDVTLAEGVLAFAMLAGLQYAVARASIRWRWFRQVVRAEPRLLLENGELRRDAMAAERVTHDEVLAALRQHGLGQIGDAAAMVLETDGSLSVIARTQGDATQMDALHGVRRQ